MLWQIHYGCASICLHVGSQSKLRRLAFSLATEWNAMADTTLRASVGLHIGNQSKHEVLAFSLAFYNSVHERYGLVPNATFFVVYIHSWIYHIYHLIF